eukprot:TRINITY_DN1892_c0_g1_i8.p1 TRINITY_DN1892_c0_g1~~TRINITY_DN1892_c0_g1_i8.p1  ORF type:complete len:428 (-),score=100.77 TRINITY_DN1892_c0_g1_i8:886-2169(-)
MNSIIGETVYSDNGSSDALNLLEGQLQYRLGMDELARQSQEHQWLEQPRTRNAILRAKHKKDHRNMANVQAERAKLQQNYVLHPTKEMETSAEIRSAFGQTKRSSESIPQLPGTPQQFIAGTQGKRGRQRVLDRFQCPEESKNRLERAVSTIVCSGDCRTGYATLGHATSRLQEIATELLVNEVMSTGLSPCCAAKNHTLWYSFCVGAARKNRMRVCSKCNTIYNRDVCAGINLCLKLIGRLTGIEWVSHSYLTKTSNTAVLESMLELVVQAVEQESKEYYFQMKDLKKHLKKPASRPSNITAETKSNGKEKKKRKKMAENKEKGVQKGVQNVANAEDVPIGTKRQRHQQNDDEGGQLGQSGQSIGRMSKPDRTKRRRTESKASKTRPQKTKRKQEEEPEEEPEKESKGPLTLGSYKLRTRNNAEDG